MRFALLVVLLTSLWPCNKVFAQSHALIDRTRSSDTKNLFVSQFVEGEFGKIRKKEQGLDWSGPSTWRGYGIRNGVGLELLRFIQLSGSHTLLNLRSKESGLENLRGSRFATELSLSFSSPVSNIQFGAGVAASQLEYQNFDKSALFVGVGPFYTMGFNYFMSPSFSFLLMTKHFETRYTVSGGTLALEEMSANFDNISFGFNIWL